MSSTSETGHVINIANLGIINSEIAGLGVRFKPANPLIAPAALVTKKTDCGTCMTELRGANDTLRESINERLIAYAPMNKFGTRIYASLLSRGASPEIIRDAKGILFDLRGIKIGKIKESVPGETDLKTVSVAQTSFVNKKSHFDDLIGLVKNEAKYDPQEDDLKVAALEAYSASLIPLNDAVVNDSRRFEGKKDARNVALYAPLTGLSELVGTVKAYLRSALGTSDPVYKRVIKIKITKPRKM